MASAHGPVLSGVMVDEAFDLIRQVARMEPLEQSGEPVLYAMIAAVAAISVEAAA